MVYPSGIDLNLAAERAYPTPLSNSALLPLLLLSLARQKNSPDTSSEIGKEYDYIVVGGGTAGSVVAARLSEVPCVSVLLLEAGPSPPRLTDVPGIGRSFWNTDIDWQFKSVSQKYTGRGLINRQVALPAGRALGGSSVLNNGLHVRGNRKDYDDWAAMGAKGWSYEEVLPYFKKLEDNRNPDVVANGYHAVGGPISVMRPKYEPEIKKPIFRAAKDMGYRVVDPNGRRQTGFYDLQANLRHSQRCHTGKAYLVPAENRTNLDILPNAFVKKVIIKNRRAVGVLFDFEGQMYTVRANREVILSAGAINTPHLLMLSGIGPKDELRKFNIPVHTDLPVGKNLQDHACATIEYTLSPYIRGIEQKLSDDENVKRFIHNRTGPLASVEALSVVAFLLNDEVNPKVDYPNYELYFAEGSTTMPEQQVNMKPEVYRQVYGPYENRALMICLSQQLHPRSRGTITLRSSNPHDRPLIDPNYLADPQDVQDIVEGMKTCKRIATNHHMRSVGSQPLQTLYPGCEKYVYDDDAYFRCQTKSVLLSLSHYAGTAKMGDPRDPTTVVDPELRVKNIQGLRVVDNSIMPKVTSGNTGVPAIMIGEKASDIIKASIDCGHNPYENGGYGHSFPQKNPFSVYDIYYNEDLATPHEDEGNGAEYAYGNEHFDIHDEYRGNKYEQSPRHYGSLPVSYSINKRYGGDESDFDKLLFPQSPILLRGHD